MHSRLIAFIGLTGLLMASPALAAGAGCCGDQAKMDHAKMGQACDMPCCKEHKDQSVQAGPSAYDLFFKTPPPAVATVTSPARQAAVVWFMQPVRVGGNILQGRYVIEHDNDRMARGEPCTHIYAYNDQKNPVVAFHCTHLDRAAGKDNTVALYSTGDGHKKFVEFQFKGETGAHGYPTVR